MIFATHWAKNRAMHTGEIVTSLENWATMIRAQTHDPEQINDFVVLKAAAEKLRYYAACMEHIPTHVRCITCGHRGKCEIEGIGASVYDWYCADYIPEKAY